MKKLKVSKSRPKQSMNYSVPLKKACQQQKNAKNNDRHFDILKMKIEEKRSFFHTLVFGRWPRFFSHLKTSPL